MQDDIVTLNIYWNSGKLLVEAQGGEARVKYGDNLIKKRGISLAANMGIDIEE